MIPIPEYIGTSLTQKGGICFTPSNTAKQNYMYLHCAGAQEEGGDYSFKLPLDDCYYLLYTCEGKGEFEYMDKKYTVGPGEGILLHSALPCRQYTAPDSDSWSFMWFVMTGSKFDIFYNQFAAARKPVFPVPEASELAESLKRLTQVASSKCTPLSELVANSLIINILTYLVIKSSERESSKRSIPAYIDGIMARIDEDYATHITLDSLAAEFNVSKFHLSREFKKYTGYSPNEYLISVRINRAKELLRRTSYSVGEISQLTGCGDVNHFIQLFKSREKTTPAAYRRHWQNS